MTNQQLDDFTESRNPLTAEEAGQIAGGLALASQNEDEAARLLLLCFALTYERDLHQREYMLGEIKSHVAPHLAGFSGMHREEMRRQLAALKGGEPCKS